MQYVCSHDFQVDQKRNIACRCFIPKNRFLSLHSYIHTEKNKKNSENRVQDQVSDIGLIVSLMLTATLGIWRQNGGTREDGGQEWLELWPTDVEDFFVWDVKLLQPLITI